MNKWSWKLIQERLGLNFCSADLCPSYSGRLQEWTVLALGVELEWACAQSSTFTNQSSKNLKPFQLFWNGSEIGQYWKYISIFESRLDGDRSKSPFCVII